MHSHHHDAHKTAAFSLFKPVIMCANVCKIIQFKIKNHASVILNNAKLFPVKNVMVESRHKK